MSKILKGNYLEEVRLDNIRFFHKWIMERKQWTFWQQTELWLKFCFWEDTVETIYLATLLYLSTHAVRGRACLPFPGSQLFLRHLEEELSDVLSAQQIHPKNQHRANRLSHPESTLNPGWTFWRAWDSLWDHSSREVAPGLAMMEVGSVALAGACCGRAEEQRFQRSLSKIPSWQVTGLQFHFIVFKSSVALCESWWQPEKPPC